MRKQTFLPANTKFRVIMNNVCFYTTKKKILAGIGDLTNCNDALQVVLCAFEGVYFEEYKKSGQKIIGLCGNARGFDVQLNLVA